VVTALTESLVSVQQPANKPAALKILPKHLRIGDPHIAEDGCQDPLLTLNRRLYPSVDAWRSTLDGAQNPKIAGLNVEQVVDARFVRKLDERGFIDRLSAAQR